jgi:hypothetical protein
MNRVFVLNFLRIFEKGRKKAIKEINNKKKKKKKNEIADVKEGGRESHYQTVPNNKK